MPDFPRACSKCGIKKEEVDFSLDRGRRRPVCRICDNQRRMAHYAEHREELYARREAVRQAARQAELEALAVEHKKRVAAAKREHEAGVRRQKKLLRELGVPDLSPEEVTAKAQRRAQLPSSI